MQIFLQIYTKFARMKGIENPNSYSQKISWHCTCMLKISFKVERVYFEIDEDKLEQWEKPQIKESKKAFFYATIRYYNTNSYNNLNIH